MGTDSESKMTASGGQGKGVQALSKKKKMTHGHGQQWEECWGKRVRELKGNGKNTVEIK